LAQGAFGQVARVAVLGFPDLEVAVVSLGGLDVGDPLGVLAVIRLRPGGRQREAVVVVEVTQEAQAIALQRRLRFGECRPRGQVLHGPRGTEHMAVHEEEVDARTVAVFELATGVALLAARAGLPADAAQGVAFCFGEFVPLVTGGVP
jgi:hypothetical protein